MLRQTLTEDKEIRDFFWEHGYAGPFESLSGEEIKQLQTIVKKDCQNLLWVIRLFLEKMNVFKASPLYDRNAHINSAVVYQASTAPEILKRVAAILGSDLLVWMSQVICRWPGHQGADWHIDQINANVEGVHVSVALSEMNRKNGCLQVIPGTHKYSVNLEELAQRGECNLSDANSMAKLADRIAPENAPHQVLSIELKPGEYFFTKGGLWHGVVANKTLKTRMAFITRFMRPEFADRTNHPCILVQGNDRYQLKQMHNPPQQD